VLRLLIALLCLGAGAGLASAAVTGVSIPQLGINVPVPADKAAALERLAAVGTSDSNTAPAPAPRFDPAPIPGEMLDVDVPVPIPASILQLRNGWLVSNGKTLVAVYAGAAGDDPSAGRVVVVRENLAAGKQAVSVLDAGPTGALTIAQAPLGRSIETSAQKGEIRLRSAGGTALVLDLDLTRLSGSAGTVGQPRPARTSDSASHPVRR
jgi:hypothetical protein